MELKWNSSVECADGACGRCVGIIIDPAHLQVTHLVIQENKSLGTQYLVPLDQVAVTFPARIQLRCERQALATMEHFIESKYVRRTIPPVEHGSVDIIMTPAQVLQVVEHIPDGEQALHARARVQSVDGDLGAVDGFRVDVTNGHLTHLVFREGHLWGKKDVTIPVSQIDRIAENTVYLKLDKRGIQALPAVPVKAGRSSW